VDEPLDAAHLPVLVDETLRYLAPERGGLFVDGTVGLGGHARAILEASDEVRVVGIDRDPAALAVARERLAGFGERVRFAEGPFTRVRDLVAQAVGGGTEGADGEGGPPRFAGILADLGVSSMQLDTPERGFSFRFDAPLDMRMGRGGAGEASAADVVNEYGEAELERIFRDYGEERQARRIARAIARARTEAPIDTTARLREVILESKGIRPGSHRKEGRVDPATRVFQALRIEVNQELDQLERFLDEAVHLLEEEGRLVVISYHSGEDRIVKNTLRDLARGEIDQVTGRPLAESRILDVLTKKPVRPTPEEEAENPRARSARLRAALRRTAESS
jgi:16S rRNA (cytosine1402-N4)-methyltransferase